MNMSRKTTLKLLFESIVLMIIGGLLYMGIEILARGYTHWTMGVLGAICFISIGLFNERISWKIGFIRQMFYGGSIITLWELLAGLFLNIHLKLNIWDYSSMPLNYMGQICLPYALLWCLLSAVAIILDDVLRWKLFNEEKPHYHWF